MRKLIAALGVAALAVLGLVAPASATLGQGATEGTWQTVQTIDVGSDHHVFTYDYTVSPRNSSSKYFELNQACYSGPGTSGYAKKQWQPLVATTITASSTATSASGFISATGAGYGTVAALSLSSGTTCITAGTGTGASWDDIIINYGSAETHGNWLKTWIGSSGANNTGYSTSYDLGDNMPPFDPSGTYTGATATCEMPASPFEDWTWDVDYSIVKTGTHSYTLNVDGITDMGGDGTVASHSVWITAPYDVSTQAVPHTIHGGGFTPVTSFDFSWEPGWTVPALHTAIRFVPYAFDCENSEPLDWN